MPRAGRPQTSDSGPVLLVDGCRFAAAVAEFRNAITALLLGGVQRGIGSLEQQVGAFETIVGLARVPDAHGDGVFAGHGALHGRTQTLGKHRRLCVIRAGQDGAKLIAAVATGKVGLARVLAQSLRHGLDRFIALRVTV